MLNSFRARLTLWYSLIIGLILAVLFSILYFNLSKNLITGLDDSLLSLAKVQSHELEEEYMKRQGDLLKNNERLIERELNLLNKYIEIIDLQGKVLDKSNNLGSRSLPLNVHLSNILQGNNVFLLLYGFNSYPLRVLIYPVNFKGEIKYAIIVGDSAENTLKTLDNFKWTLITLYFFSLVLTLGGGYFLSRKTIKPLIQITDLAQKISEGNLEERLVINHKDTDELDKLKMVFNAMLDRLEKAFVSQQQFTADASHELRIPLTIIKGESEVALRKDRDPEEYKGILIDTIVEINRMIRLLDRLLSLVRMDHDKGISCPEMVDLKTLIEGIMPKLRNIYTDKQIFFSFKIKGNENEIKIKGDHDQLSQLFINILNNAIQYSPENSRIEIEFISDPAGIITIIKDYGEGIPAEDLPRIFDRFYRVDKSRTRKQGGSGLGLSICKRIVESHKGKIEVESELGKGTTFKIFLLR